MSLKAFVRQAWSILEPATPFVDGRHIDAICDHLQAVTDGRIRRLLINIPPRCAKSLLVSAFWPAWVWIKHPAKRWIFASYAESLAIRDSLKCRRLIESAWYRSNWGDRYRLTTDQNTKTEFENNRTGIRLAASVGGAITGKGCDIFVADDPHNVMEANSPAALEQARIWWDEVSASRLDNQRTGARVIIMQRVNLKDLSGHVLEKGGYDHLCLPMCYEPNHPTHCRSSLGFKDWRTAPGELLWPERMDKPSVTQLEKDLGSFGTAGQLQQRPVPRGGARFKREWFEIIDQAPSDCTWCRYWDLAATVPAPGKEPDWTVGLKLGLSKGIWYIADIRRTQSSPLSVQNLISQTAQIDGQIMIRMEEEGGSSGKTVTDHYRREVLVGFNFNGIRSTGSKETRADPVCTAAEAGNVKLVKGPWNGAFLDEIEIFPAGPHDDQVDALSGAFNELAHRPIMMLA